MEAEFPSGAVVASTVQFLGGVNVQLGSVSSMAVVGPGSDRRE